MFRSVALMSAPFAGPPELPFATERHPPEVPPSPTIHEALAALPRPRKHYQWWYSTRPANAQMWHCKQGVHDFLRAYFHHKSADWKENRPHRARRVERRGAGEDADLLHHGPRRRHAGGGGQGDAVAAEIAACRWLPDNELAVYAGEYERNGFQGGLNWYRSRSSGAFESELQLFAGRTIDVPSIFISGKSDWGVYQRPGAFEHMQERGLHPHGRLPPARRRRPLGAAGAGGPGQRAAPGVPEGRELA